MPRHLLPFLRLLPLCQSLRRYPPQAARLIAIVAASTTDNTFLIRFLSFFLTSPSHLSDRFINSFYYFLNKLPFQHLGKKIAPFLKNSLFQLFLTMAHLFVSAFGSLFIFYLILTLILRLGKLFCLKLYNFFSDFSRFLCVFL